MAENPDFQKITIHPSVVALLIQFVTYAIPLFLLCVISATITRSPNIIHIAIIRYQVCCILLLLNFVRLYYNQILVLDEKTVTFFYGRLSFNYKKTSIAYKDIKESGVKQNILGRIFNFGTVSFASAGTGKEEIVCNLVDRPRDIASHVQMAITDLNSKAAKAYSPKVEVAAR